MVPAKDSEDPPVEIRVTDRRRFTETGDERSAGRAGTFGDHDSGARNGRGDSADGAAESDAEMTTTTTLQLPNGVLVDVLA